MTLVSIDAHVFITSSTANWSTITSFQSCSDVFAATKSKTANTVQGIAIGIYTLSELIYSIVIMRLFVDNIFKLSLFCKTQPLKESVKRTRNKSIDIVSDSEYFLNVSIKTANLLTVAVCTNYLLIIKYGLGLSAWVFLLDVFSNYVSMYLSFGFAAKYYNIIFSPCHDKNYSCCLYLCYCCCCFPDINLDDDNIDQIQEQVQTSTKTKQSDIVVVIR